MLLCLQDLNLQDNENLKLIGIMDNEVLDQVEYKVANLPTLDEARAILCILNASLQN